MERSQLFAIAGGVLAVIGVVLAATCEEDFA